jgi:hypothetical protein
MTRVRIDDRDGLRLGLLLGGTLSLVVVAALLWAVSTVERLIDPPSKAALTRQEATARQQAALDSAWRPWVTAAENMAAVSGLLAVPLGVGLGAYVVLRGTHATWPATRPRAPQEDLGDPPGASETEPSPTADDRAPCRCHV